MSQLPDVYSSAFFQLELDGTPVGTIRSVDGGGIKADVLTYQHGAGGDTWRQLGRTKYEEFKITTGLLAGKALWAWINSTIGGNPTRRTGAIVAADYDYNEKARREFSEALIADVSFPKFDATDKNPANVVVTVSPEKMTYAKAKAGALARSDAYADKQKAVSCCNFTFTVNGFENACKRVNKVDGFSVKCKIIEHQVSTRLENVKVPGKIELPNITFYLPEVDAQAFLDHHTKTTMDGQRGAPIPGAVLKFHNNAKADHGTITFNDCTIFSVTHDKADSSSEDIRMVKVEMAIEGIKVEIQ